MHWRIVAVALLMTPAVQVRADDGPLIAVLEFRNKLKGDDAAKIDVGFLANSVRNAALKSVRGGRVMTKENTAVLLSAARKSLSDCEGECDVETGRLLGADLVVSGDVLRFGSKLKVDLRLHETAEGRLLAGAQASGATPDDLEEATSKAVQELFKAPENNAPSPTPTKPAQNTVGPAIGLESSASAAAPLPPTAVPEWPRLNEDLFIVSVEASPEALVALQTAQAAEARGRSKPLDVAGAWRAVASAPGPNPYAKAATERERALVSFNSKQTARATEAEAASARLSKLLLQPQLSADTKRKLLAGFQRQYGNDPLLPILGSLPFDLRTEFDFDFRGLVQEGTYWRDTKTGLLWQSHPKAENGDYEAGVAACGAVGARWRLPTATEYGELAALFAKRSQTLPLKQPAIIWASSSLANSGWTIDLTTARTRLDPKSEGHPVLCVQDPATAK